MKKGGKKMELKVGQEVFIRYYEYREGTMKVKKGTISKIGRKYLTVKVSYSQIESSATAFL